MKKRYCLLSSLIVLTLLVLQVNPLQGADTSGKWGLGLQGGLCKLVLTDHSDLWTLGWLAGADFKYGITPKFAVGVEGNWRQHYLADLSTGTRRHDGARLTTTSITDGPRQRAITAGVFAEYQFLADNSWSPYVCGGTGVYSWKWADKEWNVLSSDSAVALVDARIPNAGKPYDLKDQQLYAMVGMGLEVFPSQALSFEVGAKFRYLTSLLSSFTGDKDIVGTGSGQLDLPKGTVELVAGLTLHFGGKKVCPPLSCQASGNPMSGSPSLAVQFSGLVSGGCTPRTYSWDFGDGGSSSDPSPQHTYQAAGNYTARLTVTDSKGDSCQGNVSSIMVGCPPLTCTASATPTSGTAPLAVQFNGSVSGGCPPYTYNWDNGEAGASSEQNPSHRVEKGGKYTARLTVTDSKGNRCQESVSYETFVEFLPTPEKPIILHGVKFEFDKSRLTVKADSLLDLVAASMQRRPDVKVEVGGHCDWIGSDAYNQKLSVRRAEAVRDYLISKGVTAENLTFQGYGETKPMADNKTAEGRALNRRVELRRM